MTLQPYRKTSNWAQANAAHELVYSQRSRLANDHPELIVSFGNIFKASQMIKKIAQSKKIDGYLIMGGERNKEHLGMATRIPDQKIIHPVEGLVEGDLIDCWLREGVLSETQRLAVKHLIELDTSRTAIATVIEDLEHPVQGYETHMLEVGFPAQLRSGTEPDDFDVARKGKIAQLYVAAAHT
jgi:hypothetical protein